jgi:AraC-like DNA-binding protein
MLRHIALIRAAGFRPFLRTLIDTGVPIERTLREAHLEHYPWDRPEAPSPMAGMFEFLRIVAEREELPDLGFRAFTRETLAEFGVTGGLVAGSRTPREALSRLSRAMPYFCSHERIVTGADREQPAVFLSFIGPFDRGGVHLVQQLNALVLAGLVDAAAEGERQLTGVEIAGWTGARRDRLRRWLCDDVVLSRSDVLALRFRKGSLDLPYPQPGGLPGRQVDRPPEWRRLDEDASLIDAISVLIDEMLLDSVPTLEAAALAMRLSKRTLQRFLAEVGTSFSELADDVRRKRALAEITGSGLPFGSISGLIGFSSQASLSRAVRRSRANCDTPLRA